MALVQPSIAKVCRSISQYLNTEFSGGETVVRIITGSPADVVTGDHEDNKLNLFFFKFEPSGFGADSLPGEINYIRIHCLATPFGTEGETISSGENDLRIIGEVIRIFQENPVFHIDVDGTDFHIQTIIQTLAMDQLNQLWSTQGDTIYRPSVMFEVSLVPVIPDTFATEGPMVGATGLDVRGKLNPASIHAPAVTPTMEAIEPNIFNQDWSPALGIIFENQLVQSLSFELGSAALTSFNPQAWIAGDIGSSVDLVWDTWTATEGWNYNNLDVSHNISSAQIDPDTVESATTQAVTLPFNNQAGQLVLYAQRTYSRAVDGVELTVRSNPVLINLYGGS